MVRTGEVRPLAVMTAGAGALLAAIIFFPQVVSGVIPVRVAIVGAGLLAITIEAWRQPRLRPFAPVIALAGGGFAVGVLWASSLIAQRASDPSVGMNLQRLFVVFPLFAALGAMLYRSQQRDVWLKPFVLAGVASSIMVAVESFRGEPLLASAELFVRFQRGGDIAIRGVAGAEHVLVLGVLLAALIPLVRVSKVRIPNVVCALLLAGVYFTGSRGPLIIAVALFLVQASPRAVEFFRQSAGGIRVVVVAMVLVVVGCGFFVWNAESGGQTGFAYSTEYRYAIYALLPKILDSVPWGLGPRSIPAGEWLFDSNVRGVRDLSVTVDSELVYVVLAFGWLGILIFAAASAVAAAALKYAPEVAMSALAITVSGYFVALHAWDTLGPAWYLLLGASAAAVRVGSRRARPDQREVVDGPRSKDLVRTRLGRDTVSHRARTTEF